MKDIAFILTAGKLTFRMPDDSATSLVHQLKTEQVHWVKFDDTLIQVSAIQWIEVKETAQQK